MRNTLILLITILVIVSHPIAISAQSFIKGTVVSSSGYGLPYATVKIARDSSHIHFAITDSTGHFGVTINEAIPPVNSGYYIQAFYLKLSSKKQVLDMAAAISLIIEDSAHVLNAVLVSTAKPVFIRKADRFVFIPNKLLTNGADALDIMRHTPLVQYDERSDAFSIINKPGTIIYINNKKSKVPTEMLIAMLRSLPAENIKSIEIITNPGSEYAASTTGGIININIRRQLYEGWLGNLALLSDQSVYNTTILNGAVNYRKGKLALQLIPFVNSSFNFNTTDNALNYTSGTQDVLKTRHYRRYLVLGGGLNMDYDINTRNLLSFGGWWSNVDGKSNTRTLTSYTKANPLPNDSLLSSFDTGKDNYVYNYGSINYHHLLDSIAGDAYLDVTVDYNNFSQKRDYNGLFDESNTNTRYRNNLPQAFHNLSERAELSHPLSKRAKLSAGVQYSNTHVENDLKYYNWSNNDYALNTALSNNYAYDEDYLAGFASLATTFNNKWSGNAGLRLENTHYKTGIKNQLLGLDSTYLNLFPSLAVAFAPSQQHQLALNFTRKISRPNIELLFPGRTYNNQNFFTENNPFLQPILYNNLEFSYTFKSQSTFLVSYSNAQNAFAGFVVPVAENGVSKLKSTYLNYGHINSLDFTFNTYQHVVKEKWDIVFSPTYNYSRYTGTVLSGPVAVSNSSYTLFFDNYVYLSNKRRWKAFLTFKYNSPTKDISGQQLNATSSLDFMMIKGIKKFALYFMVNDIYNGKAIIKTNLYANSLLSRNYTETNNYSRSVSFKIRYSFGNNQLKRNRNKNAANDEIRNRAGK